MLAEINQLNASLDRSDELVNLANLKLQQVQRDIAMNRRELAIARHNLAASQRTVAKRLVNLYTSGSTSTLEVILGAQSLDDIITRIDTANRVSSVDTQVANQVAQFKTAVLDAPLAARRSSGPRCERLVAQRAAAAPRDRGQARRAPAAARLGQRRGAAADRRAAGGAGEGRAGAAQAQVAAATPRRRRPQAFADHAGRRDALRRPRVRPSSRRRATRASSASRCPYIGTPYVWAGASPGGFDCSGLVMYAYAQVGVSLPHSSYAMWGDGTPVPRDQLEPGDIVFFNGLGHVGIYIGGGEYVHAPHTGTTVQVSSLDSDPSYDGARRIVG